MKQPKSIKLSLELVLKLLANDTCGGREGCESWAGTRLFKTWDEEAGGLVGSRQHFEAWWSR